MPRTPKPRAVSPVMNRRIETGQSSVARGFLSFGPDDQLPDKVIEIAKTSVTASACMGQRRRFIAGNGFIDRQIAETIINADGDTMDDLLRATAGQMSPFQTIAWLISYNALGQVVAVKPAPVSQTRLAEPCKMTGRLLEGAYFPYLYNRMYPQRQRQHIRMPLFDPRPEEVLSQIVQKGGIAAYPGQLLYTFMREEGDGYYHEPDWYGCIKDMQTDGELSMYDFKAVTNGFNLSGIFGYQSSEQEVEREDEQGNVIREIVEDDSIVKEFANNKGNDGTGNILLISAKTKEELDAMRWIDTQGTNLADRYNSTKDTVPRNIARGWNVPNELIGIRRQGGIMPTGGETEVAFQLMNSNVNDYQRFIRKTFERVIAHWKPGVFPSNPNLGIEPLNYLGPQAASPTTTAAPMVAG